MTRQGRPFVVIGENIHCTRKLKRQGRRIVLLADGREAVAYQTPEGTPARMVVPESIRRSGAFESGMVAHVACAVELGLEGDAEGRRVAREYIAWLARTQVTAGAACLDINVDEVSPDIGRRDAAMSWIVPVVQIGRASVRGRV